MLPEEAQAIMMKILLVVFGTIMLCVSKVRAKEVSVSPKPNFHISSNTTHLN